MNQIFSDTELHQLQITAVYHCVSLCPKHLATQSLSNEKLGVQGRDPLYDNIPVCGVDPRSLAQRIMEVCMTMHAACCSCTPSYITQNMIEMSCGPFWAVFGSCHDACWHRLFCSFGAVRCTSNVYCQVCTGHHADTHCRAKRLWMEMVCMGLQDRMILRFAETLACAADSVSGCP